MTTPKIDPGEGWRIVEFDDPHETGDELFLIDNSGRRFYRRRVQPSPTDGWRDLATDPPDPGQPIWIGKEGSKTLLEHGLINPANLSIIGWTHWQPANVPKPPVAKEPFKSAEEVACEAWINNQIKATDDSFQAAERAFHYALAWRKANP